jgi:hypothetical protein
MRAGAVSFFSTHHPGGRLILSAPPTTRHARPSFGSSCANREGCKLVQFAAAITYGIKGHFVGAPGTAMPADEPRKKLQT